MIQPRFLVEVANQVSTDLKQVGTDLQKVKAVTTFERYTEHVKKLIMEYGPRTVLAFVVLVFGWWLIRVVVKGLERVI